MSEQVMISLASLIILGIGAQWLAWRLKFPSILFLLILGFVAGPVTGFLQPDLLMGDLLLPFVSLAVAIILFEGGLTLNLKELREIGGVVVGLITVGMMVTWVITAAAAYYLLDLSPQISILLGAILVVTGPTVIGPLLRHIRPNERVNDILKWEGIVIDPIGALLAVLVFEAITINVSPAMGVNPFQEATIEILISLGKTIFFGCLTGFAFAWLLVLLIRKYWVPDFLQVTVSLSFVVAAYLSSDLIQSGSGLFAATLMGIVMANQKYISVKSILEFKENLRVLIISILFILLSARLNLGDFQGLSINIAWFLAILILVARPLSVFMSSIGSGLSIREKLFLSWMAPRGIVAAAVSSVFALRIANETGMENGDAIVPVTFSVIVVTVVIYGLTSKSVARWLKVAESDSQGILFVGAHTWALEIAKAIKEEGFKVVVVDTNRSDIAKAQLAGITTVNGSVLSENVVEDIPLGGIGKLFALTSNDEVNSLSVVLFNSIFDSHELYQLLPVKTEKGKEQDFSPKHLRGRFLFGEGINFAHLRKLFFAGAVIKSTKITKDFTYKDFVTKYGESAIPMFVINDSKELNVMTTDTEAKPKAGSTIIAMVTEKEESDG
ncbi:MAG TPA: cation:proton antiporter [Bacteroidales bacterium]|nr:cation:proton antiporter [Bacteroidales bacterium]